MSPVTNCLKPLDLTILKFHKKSPSFLSLALKTLVIAATISTLACASKSGSSENRKPQSLKTPTVLSTVSMDINNDGEGDQIILIESVREVDTSDLHIIFSAHGAKPRRQIKKSIAYHGGTEGTIPNLKISPQGNLQLQSQNTSSGVHGWKQTVTFLFKNRTIVVANYVYKDFDSLDPSANASCELNFLMGKGIRKGREIAVATSPIPLTKWDGLDQPQECRF